MQNFTYALTFAVLTIIVFSAARTADIWYNLFFIAVLVCGIICSIATYLFYFLPDLYTSTILPIVDNVYYNSLVYCFRLGYQPGIAVHYSSNGMYLALFSGCAFSLYVTQRNHKMHYAFFTVIALVSLFLTAKRAHVLFGLAAMLVVYYMANADRKSTRLFNTMAIVVAALVLFVIIGQYIPSISGVIDRFIESQESGNLLNNRSTLYLYAIALFYQNPLFGTGWGGYKYLRESLFGDYNNAHNVFLQLLAETGVFGTLLFITLFIIMLVMVTRRFHYVSTHRHYFTFAQYRVCAFAVYMQVFFLLYCMTGNPLYDRLIWVPTILSAVASCYIGRYYVEG